jgi:hypothetical protein
MSFLSVPFRGLSKRNRQGKAPGASRTPLCLEILEDRCVPSGSGVSTIQSNFNGTAIPAGDTVWFSSAFKANGLGSGPVSLKVTNQTIDFTANGTSYDVAVPDATITFSPSATTAVTSFDAGTYSWVTTLPMKFSGNGFLSGVALPAPSGLPGGINPVTWQATFSTDTAGVSVNWQWAAAVYTRFRTDSTALGVKPVDDNHVSSYQNSDNAGTPENFTAFVTGGARGGGGSNFTGSLSGTAGVQPPLQATASLSGFVLNETTNTGIGGVTVYLYDSTGTVLLGTAVTGSNGAYSFTALSAGTYQVVENPPSPYLDDVSNNHLGSLGGATGNNSFSGIVLNNGANGVGYNFNLFAGS